MIIRPAIAEVNVFLAPSTALGSPPEVINLNPPTRRRIKRTIPANPNATLTTFENKQEKLEIVAIPLTAVQSGIQKQF